MRMKGQGPSQSRMQWNTWDSGSSRWKSSSSVACFQWVSSFSIHLSSLHLRWCSPLSGSFPGYRCPGNVASVRLVSRTALWLATVRMESCSHYHCKYMLLPLPVPNIAHICGPFSCCCSLLCRISLIITFHFSIGCVHWNVLWVQYVGIMGR